MTQHISPEQTMTRLAGAAAELYMTATIVLEGMPEAEQVEELVRQMMERVEAIHLTTGVPLPFPTEEAS